MVQCSTAFTATRPQEPDTLRPVSYTHLVRSTTNDVLIHCINYGTVAGKKRNSGGIAGSEELGLIHTCENYGTVQLEAGNGLGGIAGYSVSRVNQSYALCNLKGDNKIGGITEMCIRDRS